MDATSNTTTVNPTETLPAETKTETTGKAKVHHGKVKKLINPEGWPSLFGDEVVSAVSPYALVLSIPVSPPVGTGEEIVQVHEFATGLDTLAKSEAVGVVEKFGIFEGTAEVMVRVNLPEGFSSDRNEAEKVAFVKSVLHKLMPFMASSAVMKHATGRNRPRWAFKHNGSVIAE